MKNRYWVLALLVLLSIITYIDRVCIAVAGPRMQADLGLSGSQWGWVVGAFTLSYAIFEIPTGAMGDKIGSRRTLARIVLWWSAFTSLTGTVSNFFVLCGVRFLFGAGEAGAYPNASATISRWFPNAQRARATGVVWAASRLGGFLSPFLVIPIQQAYGWRMSFYVFGVVGLVWVAVWFWWFRDSPREKPGTSEEEIAEIEREGMPARGGHGLPWAQVIKNQNYLTILAMYHTYCWGSYFYLSWLHTYLVKGRGMTENEMRTFSSLPFLVGIAGNLFGGFLSDALSQRFGLRIGRRTVGAAGLFLSAGCMLWSSVTPDRFATAGLLALGYGAMDCMLPVSWAVCMDVGKRYAGAVTGSMNMAGQLGSFLSSLVFGYLVERTGSYDLPLQIFSVFLLVSAYLFTRIDPTEALPEGSGGPVDGILPVGVGASLPSASGG
ncbi:MAG: MFS transporter [Bryobacter sp.]|nr:MFS transporter [Bryobacter sp.]